LGFAWTHIINVGFFRFLFCFFCINFNTLRIYTSTSSDFFIASRSCSNWIVAMYLWCILSSKRLTPQLQCVCFLR